MRENTIHICNKCGKTFDMWDAQENFSIESRIGYGSVFDGSLLSLRLCCDCMDKLIQSCKVSPIKED